MLLPSLLAGQAVGDGALKGRVLAQDATPLAQARIQIVGAAALVLSGSDGRFSLSAVPAGDQVLEVRLLGYAASAQRVRIVSGQTLDVQVTLALAPLPLKAVEVKADAVLRPALLGFEHRRARGSGHYFNQAEIARIQARVFTDVLRRVPGVQIQPSQGSFGGNEMVRMSRTTGVTGLRPCPVLFFINGMPFQITGDMSINQYIAPEDVVAIEVYSGASQIPPEFQANLMNARCGVVVIWTRIGTDDEEPPAEGRGV